MSHSSTRQTMKSNTVGSVAEFASAAGEIDAVYNLVKRLADVVVSLLLLIFTLPIMAVLAILVSLSSPGPIIFKQERIGRNQKPFVLYKFRTMRAEAPVLPTDQLKKSSVSYYTPVGVILRRLSMDELPQLWNVVYGQMSLIGPRPALKSQTWLNTERSRRRILDLRPGITGLAQVCGRDDLSDAEKLAYDYSYRLNCALPLDCKIALLTIKAVFTGTGAN